MGDTKLTGREWLMSLGCSVDTPFTFNTCGDLLDQFADYRDASPAEARTPPQDELINAKRWLEKNVERVRPYSLDPRLPAVLVDFAASRASGTAPDARNLNDLLAPRLEDNPRIPKATTKFDDWWAQREDSNQSKEETARAAFSAGRRSASGIEEREARRHGTLGGLTDSEMDDHEDRCHSFQTTRSKLAKIIWDSSIAEENHYGNKKDWAPWPEDAAKQPYCRSTFRQADFILAALAASRSGAPDCTCPEKIWASDGSDMNESTCEIDHDTPEGNGGEK